MNARSGWAAVLVFMASAGMALGQQRAIITFDPQAPMAAVPGSQDEEDAWFRLVDEDNPQRKVQLINDFLSDYPTSQMMHLVLGTLWQVRWDAEEHEAVIETGTRALDAYQYFIDSKLGFIDDPSRVPQVPLAMYRFADQKVNIYRSFVEAHEALGDSDGVREAAELGLEAAEMADQWFSELGLDAEELTGMTPDVYADRGVVIRLYFLDQLLRQQEEAGNIEGIIEVGERMLEVEPDNMQILLTVSAHMVDNPPEDPAARRERMERALEYAGRADAGIDDFLLRAQVSAEQQNNILGQMYFTMGKANGELGDWATALEAYQAAAAVMPEDINYHIQAGYAAANLNDLDAALAEFTRAHALAPDSAELRTTAENLYQASNGTLDGFDAYVQEQAAAIGN